MINAPHLKHRITLSNGTIVHGNILTDDSGKMTVETQLGQITLDKATIEEYIEVSEPAPEVKMHGTFTGPEQRNEGQTFIYSGSLVNSGKYNNNRIWTSRLHCKFVCCKSKSRTCAI